MSIQNTKKSAELFQHVMSNSKIIDLTALIGSEYPCYYYRGQHFLQVPLQDYDGPRGQYISNVLIMEEHCGTHCDAPNHMIPPLGSKFSHAGSAHNISVEKIPLEKFMGPAVVIDCRDLLGTEKPGFSPIIKVDKIKKWENDYRKLNKEDKVLLYTSWTELYYKKFPKGYLLEKTCNADRTTEGWPAPDENFIQYLVERGIQHIGVDFPSIGQIQDDEGPHWAALENEIVVVEKLINLSLVPPQGAYYMCFPLKIVGGTGSPCRAIAII